jgi:outer membrane immunogenic protein
MKKLLLVTSALIALGTPALAADLAARPYTKAPPPMMAAIYDWSGFYIGVNGGGGWSNSSWELVNAGTDGSHDASGGTVGGQVGYRWQTGPLVFGVEAQGNWADISGSNVGPLTGLSNQSKIQAFGLFTGQVGYAFNNVLVYAKGGAALTDNKYTISNGFESANDSKTRWGGTVGAGLEYGFAPSWSLGVEYNHLFMGRDDVTLAGARYSIKQDADLFTARLNYKFGGPVAARY